MLQSAVEVLKLDMAASGRGPQQYAEILEADHEEELMH